MKVEIDGLEVKVDTTRASDWHAFSLIRKASGEDQFGQLAVLLELVEYITDQTEDTIVAHLGGDTAKAADVLSMVSNIIKAATPKN